MLAHAPYAFVPFPEHVYQPPWANLVSHDVPFADGLSGEIEFEIETRTPLVIGGRRVQRKKTNDQSTDVYLQVTPDGRCVIPGSTLQGMIRSIIELAGSGRARFVENRRFGLRDPDQTIAHLYRNRVVGNVRTGWLQLDPKEGKRITIRECACARVHFDELATHSGVQTWDKKSDAGDRYKWWDDSVGSLSVDMIVEPNDEGRPAPDHERRARFPTEADAGAQLTRGRLVFTGKMENGRGERTKRLEWFFSLPDGERLDVTDRFETFRRIHEPGDGSDPNPTWKHFRQLFWRGKLVPVFWIPDANDGVAEFGLAFLPKLGFTRSTHDLLGEAHGRGVDLASLIFGDKAGSKDIELRRRAAFDPAVFEDVNGKEIDPLPPQILLGPKPSFYPNYVQQPPDDGKGRVEGGRHATCSPYASGNHSLVKNPKLAGAKRYPARRKENLPGVSGDLLGKTKLHVRLRAVPAGATAKSVLRFHNLRPVELGALIWALSWGGETWRSKGEDRPLRHSVGMGKPFGFGQIELKIANVRVRPNAPADAPEIGGEAAAAQQYLEGWMKAFEDDVDAFLRSKGGSWEAFGTVHALLAMADPSKSDGRDLTYMTLDRNQNDFRDVKKSLGYLPLYPKRASQRARKSAS